MVILFDCLVCGLSAVGRIVVALRDEGLGQPQHSLVLERLRGILVESRQVFLSQAHSRLKSHVLRGLGARKPPSRKHHLRRRAERHRAHR